MQPFAAQGQEANNLYGNAIGLGSDADRTAAQERYFSDPALQGVLGQQSNAMLRQFNANGNGTGGGKLALAGTRVGLEQYGNWLNRIQGLGSQGAQIAGQRADLRTNYGNNRADLDWNYAGSRAGAYTNAMNARAQASSQSVNNLLNIAGTAAKAYTAFSDVRLKRDIVRVGKLASGLPVYDFKYHWSDQPHRGVLAHEAEILFPDAVSDDVTGFKVVDYSKIS